MQGREKAPSCLLEFFTTNTQQDMKTQKQLDALDRARSSQSMMNYRQIIQGLTEKGIDPKDIALRENVLTFDAWRATGRTVRRGEKGIRCLTWIPMPDDTGAKTARPRSVYVFHISQTENLA